LDYLTTHTCLSPIRRGFAPGFVNCKKACTRPAAESDKVYQLLAHGRWFSPGTPASSTTKTGRHDIAEILLKVALNTINQSIIYFRPQIRYRYNNAHVKTRATVERSFGWLKKRFQLLHGEIRQRPERAVTIITTCTVLHNLALRLGEPMDDAQPEQAEQIVPDHRNDIRHVRDYII